MRKRKTIYRITALILSFILITAFSGLTALADITVLMSADQIPDTAEITLGSRYEGGTAPSSHTCTAVSGNVGVTFELESDTQGFSWTDAESFLTTQVESAAQNASGDLESLARSVVSTVELSSHTGWDVVSVSVTVPYYKGISSDSPSADVRTFQEKLTRYGFMNGSIDGKFGSETSAGVKQLQRYIRLLEQDVLENDAEAVRADATMRPIGTDVQTADTASADTAATGTTLTEANGVADGLLVAYFESDSFPAIRGEVSQGDSGIEVERVQTRLIRFNYLSGLADGIYCSGVAQAVKLFQYYNGLAITGNCDTDTLSKLYSDDVVSAPYTALTAGDSGDDVEKLQTRLQVLGFTNADPDGIYGSTTTEAVKVLQSYLTEKGLNASGANGTSMTVNTDGTADCLTLDAFYSDIFPTIPGVLSTGSSGGDVERLQRRLTLLKYYTGTIDGQYGSGTSSAITSFQNRHGLNATGIADASTMSVLFSSNAKVALKPYEIHVSIAEQRVYIYTYDANGEYTNLIKTMICSTGKDGEDTETPTGTFTASTGPGNRWHYFTKFNCWAQYAYYIEGDIMFHSVLFSSQGGDPTSSSVRNLGNQASHGCVRLSVEDAKWIWENCPEHTKVVIS